MNPNRLHWLLRAGWCPTCSSRSPSEKPVASALLPLWPLTPANTELLLLFFMEAAQKVRRQQRHQLMWYLHVCGSDGQLQHPTRHTGRLLFWSLLLETKAGVLHQHWDVSGVHRTITLSWWSGFETAVKLVCLSGLASYLHASLVY